MMKTMTSAILRKDDQQTWSELVYTGQQSTFGATSMVRGDTLSGTVEGTKIERDK